MPAKKGKDHHNAGKTMPTVRSTHLGYDNYAGGPKTSIGWVRCLLKRPEHLPTTINEDPELMAMLPQEMFWPARDHAMAKAMIDAVLQQSLVALAEWKRLNPKHYYGFEEFLEWAKQRAAKRGKVSSAASTLGPVVVTKVSDTLMYRASDGKVTLDLRLVRYINGDAWIDAIIHQGNMTLSRAWVHPVTSEYRVYEHYPGRWRGLRMDPRLIRRYLGFNTQRLKSMRKTGKVTAKDFKE